MMTISYPYTSPSSTLQLPGPNLGDVNNRWPKTDLRYDMSNDPHTFIKKSINRVLSIGVTLPTATPTTPVDESPAHLYAEDLLTFLEARADGSIFKYTDSVNTAHKVKLISESVAVSEVRRYIKQITFEMEVVP